MRAGCGEGDFPGCSLQRDRDQTRARAPPELRLPQELPGTWRKKSYRGKQTPLLGFVRSPACGSGRIWGLRIHCGFPQVLGWVLWCFGFFFSIIWGNLVLGSTTELWCGGVPALG